MYSKYISNEQINEFIKSIICHNTNTIILRDEDNKFINVFTNSLIGTFNFTDFECVNIETAKIYSNKWRRFMIEELDKFDPSQKLSNQYIDALHDFLEQDTIVGAIL